jgi:hypothetical protein
MSADGFTVFYAWQSDSPSRDNRNFIESALESALKNIQRTGTIERSPRLDKDTKDVPGIPDIASIILEKIRAADVFVADVSFVGTTGAQATNANEPLPNPNVMIELGYALSELGWERIALVINTATGSPDDLPFDLRNRRWPVAYEVAAGANETTRTEQKRTLTKQFQNAVETIAKQPPRQKRGTTEQRLNALEDMVSRLSGNVAQYTMLANLVSGLQKNASAGVNQVDDAQTRCGKQRNDLIKRLCEEKFERVKVQQGMFVLSICPASAPSPLPLVGKNEEILQLGLRPMYSSSWNHRRYGDRFVTFSESNGVVDAVTEVTSEGCVNATGHDVIAVRPEFFALTNQKAPTDILAIPSVAFEKSVIEAAFEYVKTLKALGTQGPWYVALGIVNLVKSHLYVDPRFALGGRLFEGDKILPPVVEIGADVELGNPQSVARALRPAFDFIWREHNYPQSLNYAETGDWVGR